MASKRRSAGRGDRIDPDGSGGATSPIVPESKSPKPLELNHGGAASQTDYTVLPQVNSTWSPHSLQSPLSPEYPQSPPVTDEPLTTQPGPAIYSVPVNSVYHQIRLPTGDAAAMGVKPHTSTPQETAVPPTPAVARHESPLRPITRSTSHNPINVPSGRRLLSTSGEEDHAVSKPTAAPERPFGSTPATKDSTCFLLKQKLQAHDAQSSHRNVVLALNLDGVATVQPFVETVLACYSWKTIKQWSWNVNSFVFRIDIGTKKDLDLTFDTLQADEILEAINFYISIKLASQAKK